MVEVEPSGHLLRGEHAASAPADIVDILYLDIYISGYLVLSSHRPHLGHPSSAPARALMEAVLASEAARMRGASTESRSGMEPHLSSCCYE